MEATFHAQLRVRRENDTFEYDFQLAATEIEDFTKLKAQMTKLTFQKPIAQNVIAAAAVQSPSAKSDEQVKEFK